MISCCNVTHHIKRHLSFQLVLISLITYRFDYNPILNPFEAKQFLDTFIREEYVFFFFIFSPLLNNR